MLGIWRLFTFAFLLLAFNGCARINLEEVGRQYYEGDPQKAYQLTLNGTSIKEDALLWQIQSGIIGFTLQDNQAEEMLEKAEKNINQNELDGLITSLFESAGAVLINDNVIPYKGFLYEGVMVNYYKALLYMSKKKYADARVEFNRANDRQRRIKEYYEQEIIKAREDQEQIANQEKNTGDQKQRQKEEHKILQTYHNLREFSHLNGYINPAIDYIAGIFFMLEKDYAKAIDFLKESYGITQSPLIAQDLQAAQNRGYQDKHTWIIIEDGKSPYKIEKRFDLPVFTIDGFLYVSLALPDMKKGVAFADSYTLYNASNQQEIHSSKIATLNPLVFNEFSKHLPFIVTRAILSTTIKTITQHLTYQALKDDPMLGLIVGLGGIIYTQATTQADLRISTTIPNSFHIIRIANMQGNFDLRANGKKIATIELLAECDKEKACIKQNNIIYIRNAQKNIFQQLVFSK